MDILRASVRKMLHYGLERQSVRITRLGHDTNASILGDRARSPALLGVFIKSTHRHSVRGVIGVEQCNQGIYV